MRKSGLHKQISSIFDGVPVPQNPDLLQETDPSSVLMPSEVQDTLESPLEPEAISVPNPARSSLVKRMSADPSECASAPSVQVGRPMPLPKTSVTAAKSGPSMTAQVKKVVFGTNKGALDARQKKMAMLVAVLCVVFGGVLFISLGGVGKTQAKAAENPGEDQVVQNSVTKKMAQDWKSPEPLPADLRDATLIVSKQSQPTEDSSEIEVSGELVVKGIVFSKTKPSAIINNKILMEGQSIDGITVVKITKEAVEFKLNDKQWTQQVQR